VDGAGRGDGVRRPIDNPTFLAYIEQVRVPPLRRGVIVLDNLAVHKQPAVRAAVEGLGPVTVSTLQPRLNPIELAFAKLKAFLRAARPRSFDQVCDLIAAALALFSPHECRNFVRRMLRGYLAYYHQSRTHLGLRKDAPDGRPACAAAGPIVVSPEVGGLHHRYDRQAA
jgi:transposase